MDRILQTWNFAKNVSYSISTLRYSYLHKQQVLLKDKLSQKHLKYTIGIVAAKVICRPSPQRSPCNNWWCCSVTKSCPMLCKPMDPSLLCPWDFPGKNTGVGCHFLLEGIFPTQGSNSCPLYWQADCLPLSHLGSS